MLQNGLLHTFEVIDLKSLIKWLGYSEYDDNQEPCSALRNSIHLHSTLRDINIADQTTISKSVFFRGFSSTFPFKMSFSCGCLQPVQCRSYYFEVIRLLRVVWGLTQPSVHFSIVFLKSISVFLVFIYNS